MGTRRKSRELLLQMLFQADMGKQSLDDVRRTFWGERGTVDAESRGFADDLFRVATDRSAEIDGLIERHAEHWRMDRMAAARERGRVYRIPVDAQAGHHQRSYRDRAEVLQPRISPVY